MDYLKIIRWVWYGELDAGDGAEVVCVGCCVGLSDGSSVGYSVGYAVGLEDGVNTFFNLIKLSSSFWLIINNTFVESIQHLKKLKKRNSKLIMIFSPSQQAPTQHDDGSSQPLTPKLSVTATGNPPKQPQHAYKINYE